MSDRGWHERLTIRFNWQRAKPLLTLKDAANYTIRLPEAEQHHLAWQAAVEALMLVAVCQDRPDADIEA